MSREYALSLCLPYVGDPETFATLHGVSKFMNDECKIQKRPELEKLKFVVNPNRYTEHDINEIKYIIDLCKKYAGFDDQTNSAAAAAAAVYYINIHENNTFSPPREFYIAHVDDNKRNAKLEAAFDFSDLKYAFKKITCSTAT